MKTRISGVFVKIAFADEWDIFLKRGSSDRPAARFNRRGQDALYLSKDEESARVALRKYVGDADSPRVIVHYQVESCDLVDLRHVDAKDLRQRSSLDWLCALESGREPESWRVADSLRASNEVGLIDPSRKNPSTWHVTLFRWNEPGAPQVKVVDQPVAISFDDLRGS